MQKLFLLDAFALIYRAFYSLGENFLYNSKGINTTAILGFTNTLYDILQKEKPTHLGVAWDSPAATHRATEHEFYKAHREAMPEDLRISLPYIRRILEGLNIPIIELDGYEADDIVGTLAKKAEKAGYEVFMVTPDKDYGQLVSDRIYMYKPGSRDKPREILGVKEILAKWDIERVDQVIDILGLMGDASDNIPGIKGIGEKTASKLLKEYDNIDNLFSHIEEIKGKLREKIEAGREDALISRMLATIILDVPVDFVPEKLIMEEPDREKLAVLFAELEFRSLGKRILGEEYQVNNARPGVAIPGEQMDLFAASDPSGNGKPLISTSGESGKTIENTLHHYHLMDSPVRHQELLRLLKKATSYAFDTETTGLDALTCEIVGASFCVEAHTAYYLPLPADRQEAIALLNLFSPIFQDPKKTLIGQNIKYDLQVLRHYGIEIYNRLEDTMIAHYLMEPELRHNMDYLSETYLGYTPVSIESLIGKKGKNQLSMRDVPLAQIKEYAAEDADVTLQLYHTFCPALKEMDLVRLYAEVEMPLIQVLSKMEYEGIRLDLPFLQEYALHLQKELNLLQEKIISTAGFPFNIESPKQLGEVLFEKLNIPYQGKKTKTGQYATDEETLQGLENVHPILAHILEFRQINKLKNTYIDSLPLLINKETGRVHTNYAQAVASTGRLSSNNPNLQNIPIRTERGREIRKAFIPRNKEYTLLSADYSQIELRIIAALSGDEAMIQAFMDGMDIHTATAAKVYHQDIAAVDAEMRRKAKMVNFGIIYGISAFGLAQRLAIPRGEAATLIEEYFRTYPRIREYMNTSIAAAQKNGFVATILGRKRYLKDIHSANRTVRSFAERNAINSPIQGSAADMIKVAMINIQKEIEKRGLQSRMLLQVHDELVFDVHISEKEEMISLIKDKMAHAIPMKVPIIAEAGTGDNWLEAH